MLAADLMHCTLILYFYPFIYIIVRLQYSQCNRPGHIRKQGMVNWLPTITSLLAQ